MVLSNSGELSRLWPRETGWHLPEAMSWDGAMNNAILISLAAVVVTIIIIAWAALRFLRADDADPFDEVPDQPHRPSRAPEDTRVRDTAPAMASGRRSQIRPVPADDMAWAGGRGDRGPDRERLDPRADRPRPDRERDRGRDAGPRERSTVERPAAADRRGGQPGNPARPAPVAARAGKPPRPADSGDGRDWDTMSDVDYWAELAAEKPFSAGSAGSDSVPAPTAAIGNRRPPEPAPIRPASRAERAERAERADRTDPGVLPARQRQPRPAAAAAGRQADFGQLPADSRPTHSPGRYANGSSEPATQSIAALARLANSQAPAQPPAPPARHSQPLPLQPRTSQPRDVTSRSSRHSSPQPRDVQPRPRPVPAPLDDDPLTSPSFPAINAADSRSYRASRSDTQPGASHGPAAYSEPAQQFGGYPDAQRSTSAPNGYPVQPAAPAGNPYGSFVAPPAASYQPAPTQQDDPSYGAYTSQEIPGGEGWYPAIGSYLPSPAAANGYDHQAGNRPAQPHTPAYHQPAYPATQYDQGGYAVQDAGYGRDAYQGYPRYGTGG